MKPLISVLGPTASGKSSLALQLAQKFDGEIISCDSMQVYREMNIGSAKPTQEELDSIPHHFVDCFPIEKEYNAQLFCSLAEETMKDIQARGKLPILSGGTGLYAKMFIYGADTLPSDKSIAKDIRDHYESHGIELLHKELEVLDKLSAERIKANDRRLMRALEAARILKGALPERSFSQEARFPSHQFILMPEAQFSRELIHARCLEMLEEGWIQEAQTLISKGLLETPTAAQSLGYREIGDFLRDEMTFEELREKLSIKTSQYAKRQRTWFRNQHPGASIHNFSSKEERLIAFSNIENSISEYLG
jgi:tRNA dimethylallyltransferase